jgi:hypothetical protein
MTLSRSSMLVASASIPSPDLLKAIAETAKTEIRASFYISYGHGLTRTDPSPIVGQLARRLSPGLASIGTDLLICQVEDFRANQVSYSMIYGCADRANHEDGLTSGIPTDRSDRTELRHAALSSSRHWRPAPCILLRLAPPIIGCRAS